MILFLSLQNTDLAVLNGIGEGKGVYKSSWRSKDFRVTLQVYHYDCEKEMIVTYCMLTMMQWYKTKANSCMLDGSCSPVLVMRVIW